MVHTGNGKGKTTSALGLMMRAAGQGLSCCMIQFMKSRHDRYGERADRTHNKHVANGEVDRDGAGRTLGHLREPSVARTNPRERDEWRHRL